MSMSILHVHAHAPVVCLCSGCMPIPMLHINAACPQTVALLTAKIAAFCKGDKNRATLNTCLANGQDHRDDGYPPQGHCDQGRKAI
jgi:hypothetical protein